MRRVMITAAVTAALATSVAACGADTAPPGSNAPTTTRTAEPTARGAPPTTSASTAAEAPSADRVSSGSPAGCGETREWGTRDRKAAPYSTDALYLVRVGQHDCFDRVVVDVNGPAEVGYVVHYVPVVTADGSGEPIPVAGRAALAAVIHTPPQGFDSGGHQPGRLFAEAGDHLHTTSGWRSLRAVRFAGYFEGQSTLAIGVGEKLPFRVFTQLDTTSQVRRIVIDIAHSR